MTAVPGRTRTSFHHRIRVAFSLLAVLMASLAAFGFLDLLFVENRVQQVVVVANLEYAVLEMRRYEKNLFLYGDPEAGAESARYARQALALMAREGEALAELGSPRQLATLQQALERYQALLKRHAATTGLADEIREQGQHSATITGRLVAQGRAALADSTARAQWALAISILILAVLVVLVGRTLSRSVVAPLKRLSEDLQPIAEGRFDHLEIRSEDPELVAFGTAFNRMLDELEARRRRLLHSEKLAALGVLVAGVAHELNNPLSNISSSCQLLLEELETADKAQLADWAGTIDSETERARRIVDLLLDFGRRKEHALETVALDELLQDTLLLLRNPLRSGQAEVQLDIPDGLLLSVDSHRMHQVFINLVRNAVGSRDGVRVRISATRCGEPLPALPEDAEVIGEPIHHHGDCSATQIVVEDDGPGIAAEVLPHVFDPFYTTREPGQGMGLGLYIVQEIIQEHDGCIAIASREGVGTQVIVRLPCLGGAS